MTLTRGQLQLIFPHAWPSRIDLFYGPLVEAMAEFGIDTPLRQAGFLSQIGPESGQLRYVEELASGAAYDNRADLGNTKPIAIEIARQYGTTPGRFWKGHGLIQTTGYNNHVAAMMALDIDCVHKPQLLCEPVNAARSAAYFWRANDLNKWADIEDIDGMSDAVNKGRKTAAYGDANGFAERLETYKRARKVLT